ncbi:hypothetical protein Tco_0094381, partial [Tanacetum coccineum]
DDDTDEEDEEPFEDEDDDEEEEEHLASADSPAIPIVDPIPSARDTEAFKTDETAPTPVPSPRRHYGCRDQTSESRGEQDTQDISAVIEDTQDRQTQLFQRVDGLVKDRQFHYETARLFYHYRDQTHADDREGAGSSA